MSYLRNILTNVITTDIDYDSIVYRTLAEQRTTAASNTVTPDPSVLMEEGGSYTIGANQPIWEDLPVERVASFTKYCYAGILPKTALTEDVGTLLTSGTTHDITVTAVTYRPNAAIVGAASNYFTLYVVWETEAGEWKEKEAPKVPTLAKLAFSSSGKTAEKEVEKALELEAELKVKAGVNIVAKSLHTGSGIVDPGGLILVTYTQD